MKPQALHSRPVTIGEVFRHAVTVLTPTSPTPRLDAEVLLMHVCGIDRSQFISRDEMSLTAGQQQALENLLQRRQRGEPVAYLTGTREFWSLDLNVSPATLIPRPETELLVEKALEHIPLDAEWMIADLGTGSGAIVLALARERPRCRFMATDISPAAVEVAKSNAKKTGTENVEFREGEWFAPLSGENPDMIVSNPPYIRAGDPHLTQGDVRFEPTTALVAGTDGLDAIRLIARHARGFLRPGGWLLFEHGWNQADTIDALLRQYGYRDNVSHRDLAGHVRVTTCRH